jgi:hypothetical protein
VPNSAASCDDDSAGGQIGIFMGDHGGRLITYLTLPWYIHLTYASLRVRNISYDVLWEREVRYRIS